MLNIYQLTRPQLEHALSAQGYSANHGKTLFRGIYKGAGQKPWELENLPLKLKALLALDGQDPLLEIKEEHLSACDGSVKFLLALSDGQSIEAVLMPEKTRLTLCISTQVGCRQGCTFCHTGKMGLKRNLLAQEIVAQYLTIKNWLQKHADWHRKAKLNPGPHLISNIVYMGMGEPLDNVEEVIKSVQIFIDPLGLGLAPKKITVSTAGHLTGLKRIREVGLPISLAFSLHASDHSARSRLMPINRRFPLADVLAFFKEHTQRTKKSIMIQFTLIAGVNDELSQAQALVELLQGIRAKLNIIPLNPINHSRLLPPSPDKLNDFANFLRKSGIQTTVRYSKGQDIAAACGQLIV